MALNIIKTAALSLALGWALPVLAQPMETPGETYGQLGLGLPQATGYAARNGFRSEANFEPMRRYRASSRLGPLIRYVGYLDVKTAAGTALKCTATLIAADRLLTNAHCFPEGGRERAISAQFQLGYLSVLDKDSARRFAVAGAVQRHDRLDYAVLALKSAVPGWVDPGWRVRAPRRDEPLLVVGHPLAQPLHVTQAGCVAMAGFDDGADEMLHSCDTEQGSSGALLFSADDPKQIVGLHKEWTSEGNRALRLMALDWSAILRRGTSGQGSGALYPVAVPTNPATGVLKPSDGAPVVRLSPRPSGGATVVPLANEIAPIKVLDTGERYSFVVQTTMGKRSEKSCTYSIENRHLEELDRLIREYMPQTRAGHLVIEGHTDNRGDANVNIACSQVVAKAYLQALQGTGVLDFAGEKQVIGYGESRPIASNSDEAGQSMNSRIVVSLLY